MSPLRAPLANGVLQPDKLHVGTLGSTMAIQAVARDGSDTQHLIIGLNRDDVQSIMRGEVFTLPRRVGGIELSRYSDIIMLFAETDDELLRCLPTGSSQT